MLQAGLVCSSAGLQLDLTGVQSCLLPPLAAEPPGSLAPLAPLGSLVDGQFGGACWAPQLFSAPAAAPQAQLAPAALPSAFVPAMPTLAYSAPQATTYSLAASAGMPQATYLPLPLVGLPAQPFTLAEPSSVRSIFFAGVTPVVTPDTLRALFSQFGVVEEVNLFRPYSGSKTSKGCGLVVFGQRAQAAAAMEALSGRFQWPGARSPMVLEWMDPAKQHKKARAQPLTHTVLQQLLVMQAASQHATGAGLFLPGQLCVGTQLPA